MHVLKKLAGYWDQARAAQAQSGVPPWRQWRECLALGRSLGRIGPGDYYNYRLFEPDLSFEQKAEFAGWRMEAVLDGLNRRDWACLGLDKVLTAELMQAQGLRCTTTRAIYLPGRPRRLQQARHLADPAALRDWLRTPAHYPFFGKPSASGFGRGACFATAYDAPADSLRLRNGELLPVEGFDARLGDHEGLGYLFQVPVQTDPRLVPQVGNLVTSLRLMVLLDDAGPARIHRTFWKLPTGNNMNDNYNDGRTGNLAAALDPGTGRITRVVNGSGLGLRELRQHPDTGVDLHEVAVPDWAEVQRFACEAALLFPKLGFQQWDIALSSEGPLALELNLFGTGGGELSQMLYRRGLLDREMQQRLRRHRLIQG